MLLLSQKFLRKSERDFSQQLFVSLGVKLGDLYSMEGLQDRAHPEAGISLLINNNQIKKEETTSDS